MVIIDQLIKIQDNISTNTSSINEANSDLFNQIRQIFHAGLKQYDRME